MKIEVLRFDQISASVLYDILQLRSEVFVLEQNCAYQDIDGKDQNALHVLGWKNKILVAYARCFSPGDYFSEAAIGRVLVREKFRQKGYGHQLTQAAIDAVNQQFQAETIKISAQTYLQNFYRQHGFSIVGNPYLEDGIPHIAMIRN